jgi:hypothetical protein
MLFRFRSFLSVALIFVLAACSSSSGGSGGSSGTIGDGGNSPNSAPPSMRIGLPEVSGACLNLEKYYQRIRALPGTVSARKVTKSMGIQVTGNSLPRNFRLRLAAGNFQMKDATLADMSEFTEFKQEDCNKVTLTSAGHSDVYSIIRAKPDSITIQNDWGDLLTVTWKDLSKVQIEETSNVGDYLCDPNSRARLFTVMEISWGEASIFTPTLSGDLIDSNFLSQVIEATGYSASVYSEDKLLLVDRLKEMQALPVRTDLLQCY